MAETKAFPTAAVLSTITGILLTPDIGDVYLVLNWMTGESVYTHQIPRISREAEPVILAMHPKLRGAVANKDEVTPENWRAWLAKWTEALGAEIAIPKLSADQHERIDPLSELAETFHPDKIIVVSK